MKLVRVPGKCAVAGTMHAIQAEWQAIDSAIVSSEAGNGHEGKATATGRANKRECRGTALRSSQDGNPFSITVK
jgi:hypothetical protein